MIKNKILWSTRGDKMYTEDEKIGFSNAAESLKKYRRAELVDDNSGKSLLDKLYVDLLPGNVVLEKCMRDNTTFLVGRKGTGKSTIFLKLENEYRKRKQFLPCYVDVKTIYESSQAQAINQPYLEEFFDEEKLNKYLISRNFIRSTLKGIYEEIDKQRQSIFGRVANKVRGNGNESIKKQISELLYKIEDNEKLKDVEIPILQQRKNKLNKESRNQEECVENSSANINANIKKIDAGVKNEFKYGDINECKDGNETEYTNILLQVFEIKNIIDEIKSILKKMGITKLVIMLDDVSEIEETAIKLFIDTVVAPLNNWSEEFVKFKVAFYPSRVHYGKIDPGKIDIINLDFYNLYSEFDTNKMEENAIDFTKRLLENRFQYYVGSMDQFFDDKMTMPDVYTMFFRTSMNVPRIMGYLLAYLYQSVIIYGKKITKQDIENASEKYYEDNIDAFFRSSTYCLLSIEEKRNIAQLKKVRDAIVDQAKEIKRQIVKGELTGRLYQKTAPYSSHFHVLQNTEKYLESLELNHFITKYEEKSNRDGKKVNVYCLNYGLAKKNNIIWGRAQGTIYRKYFIERIFNFTSLVLEQIRETKVIKCTNPACGRIFDDSEIPFLTFTRFQCPDCHSKVETYSKVDEEIEHQFQQANKIPLVSKEELDIILELNRRKEFCKARDIAEEIDMESRRIAQICKKLDEDKGIVIRNKRCNPYEYCTSEIGEKYSDVEVS